MFRTIKRNKGFGLTGVIIAVFFFSIGMVAVLTLAQISLRASSVSKMRLIAAGLAQEGVEVIISMRSFSDDWTEEWYNKVTDGEYRVEYDMDNLSNLLPYSDTPLRLDGNYFYQYSSGEATPFYRKVTLNKVSDWQVNVTVEVKWKNRNQWRYLKIEDQLYDWK